MFEPGRERVDLEPGRGDRLLARPHPCAVGIFSVGMAPCGFAAGIAGALPQAGSWRARPAAAAPAAPPPPTSATPRANMLEKLTAISPRLKRVIGPDGFCRPNRARLTGAQPKPLNLPGSQGGDRSLRSDLWYALLSCLTAILLTTAYAWLIW